MAKVVIVGAGAAGLFCAREAALRGHSVFVLEHNDRVGKKILISGGGRCNFTHLFSTPQNFISENPHFCKSALARFTPQDFLALVQKYQIDYFEKTRGQLFCKTSAKEITQMLLQECQEVGVNIRLSCHLKSVKKNDTFVLATSQGDFSADALVVATGGLSFPSLGATDWGYQLARQFGHQIIPCRPALTPFLFSEEDQERFSSLSGISFGATVSIQKQFFKDDLLFTHRGLSGPAILQISSYWKRGDSILIDSLPEITSPSFLVEKKRLGEKRELKNVLSDFLPKRFAETWCEVYQSSKSLLLYSDAVLEKTLHDLKHWRVTPAGTEGYSKAEVTRGGVDTTEISSKTMESLKTPGLYFIGEVLDVTGHLGGHNFQWAWASAAVAGRSL